MDTKSASLNPTEHFPNEVVEMIFNHFRGKELLKNSTVNWFWNDHIGASKKCTKKMELRIGSDRYSNFDDKERNALVISRMHQNIRVSQATDMYDYVFDIMSSLSEWNSVTIVDTEFASTSSFIKILETFEGTVETLKLYRVLIKEHEEIERILEFKELKSLTISGCSEFIFTDIFLQCPALKSLEIFNPENTIKNPSKIHEMLKCHEGITNFNIDGKWFNFIFGLDNYEDFPEFPFQLKELSIYGSGLLIKMFDDIFINFLESQPAIKTLYLGDCLGCEVQVIIAALKLKTLKTLSLLFLPNSSRFRHIIDIPRSESIESLDMLTVDIDDKDEMRFILKSVPNVKNLRLRTMDEETARFMAENLKSLQKILSVHIKDEKIVREVLPNVKII